MGKILPLDILDIFMGGIVDINLSFPDKIREVFLVHFSPVFCFNFLRDWHWGGSGVVESVVYAVVVGGGCGCGSVVSKYLEKMSICISCNFSWLNLVQFSKPHWKVANLKNTPKSSNFKKCTRTQTCTHYLLHKCHSVINSNASCVNVDKNDNLQVM